MAFHSGFVAILGRPNVGKSTLMNALIGQKVAITSPRSQTTRSRIMGILTDEERQIVFLDTPGLHTPRTRLGEYMVKAAKDALDGADAVLLLLDASEVREQDRQLVEQYCHLNIPTAVVVNKIDLVNAQVLAPLLASLADCGAEAFLPISAKNRKGLDAVLATLTGWLPEGPKYFPEDAVTDQPERVIVSEMIREKALRNLRDEIPHGVGVEILSFEGQDQADRTVTIHANLYVERDSHKRIIIGKQGSMLRTIGEQARQDIEKLLARHVNLQLWVKVRPDWRNHEADLRTLGYSEK